MRRGVLWVIVTVSTVVGLVAVGYWVVSSDSVEPVGEKISWSNARTEAERDSSVVPEPVNREATVDYLAGRAAPLLILHDVAVNQVSAQTEDTDGCRRHVDRLNQELPQDVAAELISGIPDEPLQAYFEDERATLAIVLAKCLDPAVKSPVTNPVDGLSRAAGFADVRLDVLGVSQ